ncbi:inner membrane-spanning protein YciB [Methylomonas sp. AM2-LC]|uniref:inner membrane-spanning protein YciB n=1 Tax=Methylomonas sp. AM2-LC TaxID=3153301 RepID=UPI003264ABE4
MISIILEAIPFAIFFIAYKIGDIYIATEALIVSSCLQIAINAVIQRKVTQTQWAILAIVIVFGGATLYFRDEQFVKWKLTIIEWLFGFAYLISSKKEKTLAERSVGFFFDKAFDSKIRFSKTAWSHLNSLWVGFFFFMGLINIYVIHHYDTDAWIHFKTFFIPSVLIGFTLLQTYIVYERFKDRPRTKIWIVFKWLCTCTISITEIIWAVSALFATILTGFFIITITIGCGSHFVSRLDPLTVINEIISATQIDYVLSSVAYISGIPSGNNLTMIISLIVLTITLSIISSLFNRLTSITNFYLEHLSAHPFIRRVH